MLGKLTKYEFMASAKNFLPLYGAIIIISIINRIFVFSDIINISNSSAEILVNAGQFFDFIMMMLFFAIVIAIGVITLLAVIQRFYKNLYCDQGYLMHTLPVHKWQLIASKLTVSVVWIISSGIVIMLAILILFANSNFIFDFFKGFTDLIRMFGYGTFLEGIVLAIVACCSTVLSIYAAISVGNMFNSFKVLWSFGAYVAFSLIESNIMFLGINILDKVFNIFNYLMATDLQTLLTTTPHAILALLIAYELMTAVVYFFITHIIMDKKLNLQ